MSNQIKAFLTVYAVLAVIAMAAPAYALVIGDWEGTPDGWIDWGNLESIDSATNMPSKYQYGTIGATRGTQSLHVIQSGWGQSLSIKLDAAQRDVFMISSTFSIDMSVAANDGSITGGYSQINEVSMNAPGAGWTSVASGNPVNFYWWAGSPQRTQTLTIDYTAFRDAITTPDYIEIILTLNTGGGAPPDMYFDNAQITGTQIPYDELVRESDPVLYLKFESTPLADTSTYARWVQQRGGAVIAQNVGMGNAIHLNGSSTGCVAASVLTTEPSWGGTYGDTFSFAPDDITFEFWARIESMAQYGLFFQQIGPYTREDFAPGIGNSGPAANTLGVVRILNGTEDANDMDFWYPADSNTPSDGGWHHYVVTYDEQYNSDPNQMQIQFYLDGALKGSTVVGGAANSDLPAKLGPELDHLVIGGANNRGYVYNTVTGFIDEFAIYAGVLESDRVAAHYMQGRLEIEPQNCQQVFQREQGLAADFDQNCVIDLRDFVYIAQSWLICNDPALFETDPDCAETW
jgi:hypothetical protein